MRIAGFPRVDILKLDVEGAEAEVFRGPTAWLARQCHRDRISRREPADVEVRCRRRAGWVRHRRGSIPEHRRCVSTDEPAGPIGFQSHRKKGVWRRKMTWARQRIGIFESSRGPSGPSRYVHAILRTIDPEEFDVVLYGHASGPYQGGARRLVAVSGDEPLSATPGRPVGTCRTAARVKRGRQRLEAASTARLEALGRRRQALLLPGPRLPALPRGPAAHQ